MEWIAYQGVKDEDKQPHTLSVRQVFDFGKAAVGVWMILRNANFTSDLMSVLNIVETCPRDIILIKFGSFCP